MEFKYDRNDDKTRRLLDNIRHACWATNKAIDDNEPEYDPNDNLAFILHLMDLVRQEGPVFQGVMSYLADCYKISPEEMNRRCEKHNHKAVWCVDATAVARFDTMEEARRRWGNMIRGVNLVISGNGHWVDKSDIAVMSEDEFNKL